MNRNKLTVRMLFGIFVLILGAVTWPRCARAQANRTPLTKPELIGLLENSVSPDRVGVLAKQYGISFQMTEETEAEFRRAGADDELIGMLRGLAPTVPKPAPAPAPAPPPKKEEPVTPKKFLLKEGTEVKLRFAQDLSSKTATEGDPVSFLLAEDISVPGAVVVRSGAPAVGEVSHAVRAGHLGKAGELSVRINYVKAGNARIRLRGTKGKEGEGKTGTAVTLTMFFGPLGLLKHGKQVKVKEGSLVRAYVDEDISLGAAP